ncbi:PAS sensor diguanylate cyclase and phophodiesterase [gamma proteobacterium NOR5-3]|nr:PAS sensor diguanylate cyclase and phophodiesterase [gamma proteobacterium NOR5-3]
MSNNRLALPAYLRLPDGLRFAGVAEITDAGSLLLRPKQSISPLPPEGLPVHLIIAGLPDDEEAHISIAGSIETVNSREVLVAPDEDLPDLVLEVMDPDSILWLPGPEEAEQLISEMLALGHKQLNQEMRRFLVELGDRLFDLSTSSRYGMSGQHAHYDALNVLKRNSEDFLEAFSKSLSVSVETLEKETDGQTFADLEAASARNLDLVALDEMDQKLAVDKIVNALIEKHRVELESLTIRTALVADREPRRARTPFHPAYVLQAFMDAFEDVSDSPVVIQDTLTMFREAYAPTLEKLYPALNAVFIAAGVEPGLEEDIRENGSLLNPVEKRIIKSTVRTRPGSDSETPQNNDTPPTQSTPVGTSSRESQPAQRNASNNEAGARSADSEASKGSSGEGSPGPSGAGSKHDAMYDAVISALDTNRERLSEAAGPAKEAVSGSAEDAATSAQGASATGGTAAAAPAVAPTVDQAQLLNALLALQASQPQSASLEDLQPLESLVKDHGGLASHSELDPDGANRLSFVDTVFRTLSRNFEVSDDMAPSLARLRVPLARLSLQEPRFFAQPEHPAHKLLDKISRLASADHTLNRSLQKKVAAVVERVAEDYIDDSAVFSEAQSELDTLLSQQTRSLDRNIERVISGLQGQERLNQAQRSVERLLDRNLDKERAPRALVDLLDGGWRSALVQIALRDGEESIAWKEEEALLRTLVDDFRESSEGGVPEPEVREVQQRLQALNRRLNSSNPGSVAHESALRRINAVITGKAPVDTTRYSPRAAVQRPPDSQRVEQLPRLRRWLKRVEALEPGAKLRYRGKDGRQRKMRLVWISEDRDQFAFVNERGQKIAEMSAIQLARQLSRGAQMPTPVDEMSVLDQSMFGTLEQAQKTLSFDRNRDSVTQLINGESLLYQLQRTLRHAQAKGSEHAFLLLDIDNFALVNDVFDDTSGDQVLNEFGRLLAQINDRRALTARMEGDEFGILLTYRDSDEARRIADKIRTDIASSSLNISGELVSFTVSIGVASVLQTSASPASITQQARQALTLAKTQGKDQVVVFDTDQEEVMNYKLERASSRKQLDDAMSTDSLVLRAQPIVQSAVDGREGAKHHYEILLSLRDDNGELQSPQDFIMSAERFGYVTLVDRWVLKETFSWISLLMDSQKEVPELSINLSGTSITNNDFLDYVLEQISEYGVGTSKLCFEITETGAIDNLPRAADFVRTLKNIGCKFSLDDFGTGLASHKYLKELPVDYVKIDGTFITDIHNNATDYAMTKSINDLAHFLGQKTVAECVENLEIVPALREIGIDYLQGWGIGMPRELHEVTKELANLET